MRPAWAIAGLLGSASPLVSGAERGAPVGSWRSFEVFEGPCVLQARGPGPDRAHPVPCRRGPCPRSRGPYAGVADEGERRLDRLLVAVRRGLGRRAARRCERAPPRPSSCAAPGRPRGCAGAPRARAGSGRTGGDAQYASSGTSRYVPVALTIAGLPACIGRANEPLTSPRWGKRRSTTTSAAAIHPRKSRSSASGAKRHPLAQIRRPIDHGVDVVAGDAPAHQDDVHRRDPARCIASSSASRRFAGFRSPGATTTVRAPRASSGAPQLTASRLRGADRLGRFDRGMRHHEDRRSATELLEVAPAEVRMDDDAARAAHDVRARGSRRGSLRITSGEVRLRRCAAASRVRHVAERLAQRPEPSHEVVQREIVQHDERRRRGTPRGRPPDGTPRCCPSWKMPRR